MDPPRRACVLTQPHGSRFAVCWAACATACGARRAPYRSDLLVPDPTLTSEPPDLLHVAPAGEPPNANRSPAKLSHQLRKPPVGAGAPRAPRNLQHVEHDLRGHPLGAKLAMSFCRAGAEIAALIRGGDGSFLPSPFTVTDHRRAVGVLDLDPVTGHAGPVGRRQPRPGQSSASAVSLSASARA
jgi:hypothetical protein